MARMTLKWRNQLLENALTREINAKGMEKAGFVRAAARCRELAKRARDQAAEYHAQPDEEDDA